MNDSTFAQLLGGSFFYSGMLHNKSNRENAL